MNRIQLVIFNEQVYSSLISEDLSPKKLFEGQNKLVSFSCDIFNEISGGDNNNLKSIDMVFDKYGQNSLVLYEKLFLERDNILNKLEDKLLSKATFNRLPMLLKSLYITYFVTKSEFKDDKIAMNEIIEISKMYLETKFVKMLNKLIDEK